MTAEAALFSCCCGGPPAPPGCCPCITSSRTVTWTGSVTILAADEACLQYSLTASVCPGYDTGTPFTYVFAQNVLKSDIVISSPAVNLPRQVPNCAYQSRLGPAINYQETLYWYRYTCSDNQFGWREQVSLLNDPEQPNGETTNRSTAPRFWLTPFQRSLQSCPGVQATKWEVRISAGFVTLVFRSNQETCNPTSWYLHDLTIQNPRFAFAYSTVNPECISNANCGDAYCQPTLSYRCITGNYVCPVFNGGPINGGVLVNPGTVTLNPI